MKPKTIMITGILSAVVLMAGVTACKHGHRHHGFDEFDLSAATDRIAHRLDLTESQKADFERIAAETTEKAKAMQADKKDRLLVVADLIRQEAIDKDSVNVLIDAKMEKMQEMIEVAVPRLLDFHATLTPEQRDKIAARIEDHAADGCRFGSR